MRLIKEQTHVTNVIWFTYCSGYKRVGNDIVGIHDVLVTKATASAAENYLRHKYKDRSIVVTLVEHERTVWRCDLDKYLAVADNTDGKTLDTKE